MPILLFAALAANSINLPRARHFDAVVDFPSFSLMSCEREYDNVVLLSNAYTGSTFANVTTERLSTIINAAGCGTTVTAVDADDADALAAALAAAASRLWALVVVDAGGGVRVRLPTTTTLPVAGARVAVSEALCREDTRCAASAYVTSGFLLLEAATLRALADDEVPTNATTASLWPLDVRVQQAPVAAAHAVVPDDGRAGYTRYMYPMYAIIAFMPPLQILLVALVTEKEKKVR